MNHIKKLQTIAQRDYDSKLEEINLRDTLVKDVISKQREAAEKEYGKRMQSINLQTSATNAEIESRSRLVERVERVMDAEYRIRMERTEAIGRSLTLLHEQISSAASRLASIASSVRAPVSAAAASSFSTGGKLPGYGGGDTIPALLEKGEYVIRKEAVQKYGEGAFEKLNSMIPKFASGGLDKFIESFSVGGKLPGFGGGDTIPALLEKGEYVIREEAVQKYGTKMFENLNSMMTRFSDGGSVRRIAIPNVQAQKFSDGGSVGTVPTSSTINVTVAPTFMTGDRNSVQQVAQTLRDEIRKIDHRYGVA